MLKKVLIIIFIISSFSVKAQWIKGEFGLLAGTSYYLGDINHSKQFYSPKPSFGLLYRKTFNKYYAFRVNVLRGELSGNDADFKNDYQKFRNYSFSNVFYELNSQIEINFLPYNNRLKYSYTPYISTGVALMYATASKNKYKFTIPMGMGVKYAIARKLTLGVEWVFRTTFSDNLDLLENYTYSPAVNINPPKQMSNKNNKDWYSIALITLSYRFKSDKQWCPAYPKSKLYKGI